MELDEAIKTAIEYETKVKAVYIEALEHAEVEIGQRVFQVLADEEQHHLDYLYSRLSEWEESGSLDLENLDTMIPTKQKIEDEVKKLKFKLKPKESEKKYTDEELNSLKRALEVENETSEFYKKMVTELSTQGQELFMRFVEIEEGHKAIVQAEIDSVTGLGYWFDMPEFNLASG
jgi:rubrerythrin